MKHFSKLLMGIIFFNMSAVYAGNQPGQYTITLADGYYFFAVKRKMKNVNVPNAEFTYNFNERWAIDADIGLINTRPTAGNVYPLSGIHGGVYLLDGLYRFTPYKKIEFYGMGGVGIVSLQPNGNNSDYAGNINVGVGAQVFAASMVALRLEARDLYTLAGGYNDGMVNVGVSLLF